MSLFFNFLIHNMEFLLWLFPFFTAPFIEQFATIGKTMRKRLRCDSKPNLSGHFTKCFQPDKNIFESLKSSLSNRLTVLSPVF